MEADDLYPNSGEFIGGVPLEPLDQRVARKKETASTLEAIKTLEGVVERLNEQIAFYERNSSIPEDVRTDPREFLIMSNTHLLVVKVLTGEKEYIESLIDGHR